MSKTRLCIMCALLVGMVFGIFSSPPHQAEGSVLSWIGFAVTLGGIIAGIFLGKPPSSS